MAKLRPHLSLLPKTRVCKQSNIREKIAYVNCHETDQLSLIKSKRLIINEKQCVTEMVEFTQRFCSLGCSTAAELASVHADAVSHSFSDP